MNKFLLLVASMSMTLSACVSNQYTHPSDLRFQDKNVRNHQKISVKRNNVLCSGDTEKNQNCPIEFYIDNIKAGTFYINNQADYTLESNSYNLKVKNCTYDSCKSCDVDLIGDQLVHPLFILSLDSHGKPFILNNGNPLVCKELLKESKQNTESTLSINLAADTLFKFNGSTLNDLLPEGHQEILDIATQISQKFISVNHIKLTGHTDRLGSEKYNQQLGQKRADTVRSLLIQNGVSENIISVVSAGKHQPVSNGCNDLKQEKALKACLQPDRRVTVKITGISK